MFKFTIILIVCSLFIVNSKAQDSLNAKFGIEYNVNTGYFYSHSLGGSILLNDKHKIAINGLFFPAENPFRGKMNFGVSGDYYFFPNKISNRFDLLFISSIYYSNFKDIIEYNYPQSNINKKQELNYNSIELFIGLGFNFKVSKKINITATLSSFIIGHTTLKSKTIDYIQNIETSNKNGDFDHLFLEDFMMNDLLVKIGINYLLK